MADEDPLATLDDPRAEVGKAALENPDAQEEFRDSPEFEELEAEFRKLETGGPNAVNWKQLNDETVKVLQTTSKDLVLATRLAFGLFVEEGYAGLATGLVILRDLTETHWETMVPPLRRERGRAGAYDWLAEKLAPMVEAKNPEGSYNGEIYIAHDALLELDNALEQKMTKSQVALGPLVRALRPYARDAKAALEEARKAAEAAAAAPAEAEAPAAETAATEASPAAAPAEPATPAPAPQAAAPAPKPAAATAAPVAEIAVDTTNTTAAMQAVLNAASKAATAIRQQAPTDARGYYAARFALWGRVQELPPSNDGKTALPPPQKAKVTELAALKGAGNNEGLIKSAESAFVASPFWLDAQFHLASAMEAAGESYDAARRLVIGELSSFTKRFPNVSDLSFSDGTPFASVETKDWISAEVSSGGSGGGGGGSSELDRAFSEAVQLALAGKTMAGLASLKTFLSARGSGRDWFQTQLKIGEFCLQFELIQPLFALLSSLRTIAAERDLAHWDPELAVALARLSWQSLGHKNAKQFLPDADALQVRASVMETLSLLDVGAAAELTGRK
ncbi:type VI secretion system protein TssA [Labrenzia sp. VG12]|uniref:type VI secretion system protein TssA n=1 Tax=Labrenzia sp. VG12 TaxID=2021862 RepID=UPI000B8C3649|nr:type VI secretion system protein TssA [Labrenzia sp. VG12]ASP35448.1 type VI secretion system ImpA domain-containing protein [Labrenzia sp. VG12]